MNQTDIMPAPEINVPVLPHSKWEREHHEFQNLLPSLLKTHRGKYVAIHNGKLVGAGDEQARVALEAYSNWGYVPIYVGLVTDNPQPIRIASPRLPRADA
jgi:hypothetical protein